MLLTALSTNITTTWRNLNMFRVSKSQCCCWYMACFHVKSKAQHSSTY